MTPDSLAEEILNDWSSLKNARSSHEAEMIEIQAYLTATSTVTTENKQLPFKNSTTLPKLAEIAINIKANLKAHLFSNPNWAQFEAFDRDSATLEQRRTVEAYIRTKVRRQGYEEVFNTAIDSFTEIGACFAQQEYVTETGVDANGNTTIISQGPVLREIPYEDIVFDVTAADWKSARKIIRKVYSLGDIAKKVKQGNNPAFTEELLEDLRSVRLQARQMGTIPSEGMSWKNLSLSRDGFGNMLNYLKGDTVEIHEFYGDLYSLDTGELLENHKIQIIDRRKVLSKDPISSPNGSQYLYYTTPEPRAGNLLGMSPLARIVGMQYKLDKLENQFSDVMDMIANPTLKKRGVDISFSGVKGAPGGTWEMDTDSDVSYLFPDTTILNADFKIPQTMQYMEELSGSPRNTAGVRTPGEKTKFEVQFLDQGANRLPRERAKKFETNFMEPILNDMVQLARDNMGESDLVSTEGTQFNTQEFISVTKDMLVVSGKLRARGSQLFSEKATALQNLIGVVSNPAFPVVQRHFSSLKLAKALEELGDLGQYGLVLENIAIQEDQESQRLANEAQTSTMATDAAAALPEEQEELDDAISEANEETEE